jgi:hypothetical protein
MGMLVNGRYFDRSKECVKRKMGKPLFKVYKEKRAIDNLQK